MSADEKAAELESARVINDIENALDELRASRVFDLVGAVVERRLIDYWCAVQDEPAETLLDLLTTTVALYALLLEQSTGAKAEALAYLRDAQQTLLDPNGVTP